MFSPTANKNPQRTCAACRAKTDKQKLIRIVKSPDGAAVIDRAKKLPGRGVYICPDSECIELAKKSGSLSRALKTKINDENFWNELKDFANNFSFDINLKIRSILGLSKKSGALLIGSERIEKCRDKKILVMLAEDCSEGVKNFLAAHEDFIHVNLDMNVQELSEVIGSRGGVQILGLPLNSGFAKKIMNLNNLKGEKPFER